MIAPNMKIVVQPPYGDAPDYIAALVDSATNHLESGFDHLLFSFHGIPERHCAKSDPTGSHCLTVPNCCETASPAHATCYRAQCFKTMAAFVAKAGVPGNQCSISFQSRLGRDPWLKPYTDVELAELPKRGYKRLLVICPAFVSDCLETLEEIGHSRPRNIFIGGREGIRADSVSERASALDCRAGKNGPAVFENSHRLSFAICDFSRLTGCRNRNLTVSRKKPMSAFFLFRLFLGFNAVRTCGCKACKGTAAGRL